MSENVLKIATGKSAFTKRGSWRNVEVTWDQMVARLSKPVRTKETLEQYEHAIKQRRDKIKDVGGYVGGYLHNGVRSPSTVVCRSLITLDVDYAEEDTLERIKYALPYAFVIHSTHSHTAEAPRYRLILPLDRDVTVAEYVPIARRLAEYIDIEAFDETGYQPFRLMYWPSCSKDADYFFYEHTGQSVPCDLILGTYVDYNDVSAWPTSKQWAEELRTGLDKLENPLEKPGVIGAFCQTYDIHEAIATFLESEYEAADKADETRRYTYTRGSTSGGMIVYDDVFAYSHHGTDPISGRCVNAYDLVRIHKFGDLDKGSSIKNSMAAMDALCLEDRAVKATLASNRLSEVKDKFGDAFADPEPADEDGAPAQSADADKDEGVDPNEWMEELEANKQGKYLASSGNLRMIFDNDPRLAGKIKLNIFDNFVYVFPGVPWRKLDEPERIGDVDYAGVRSYIEIMYGISSSGKVDDALRLAFNANTFHPIRDYLNEAADAWDGENRIDNLLPMYVGAAHNAYTVEAMRVWLAGAVARIFRPGCKFDLVLTLVGDQGVGKSTFFSALGGEWYSDSFSTFHGKEAYESIQGAWVIEMPELSGLRRSTIEAAKHFISKRQDQVRMAYERTVGIYKRQCVLGATTNEHEFLQDHTGNRRFLPVDTDISLAVGDVFELEKDHDLLRQIWGEAVHNYRNGQRTYLAGKARRLAQAEQASHAHSDARLSAIVEYLQMPVPNNWDKMTLPDRRVFIDLYNEGVPGDEDDETEGTLRNRTCAVEIWVEVFGNTHETFDRSKSADLGRLLSQLPGWKYTGKQARFNLYGKQRYYERVGA